MNEEKKQFISELKDRTKKIALRIIKMHREMPKSPESTVIGRQILRSATSVAANYRAACRARSGKEYYAKLSIVIEETDETLFWLELLVDAKIFEKQKLEPLMIEVNELLSIFLKSRQTMNKNKKNN